MGVLIEPMVSHLSSHLICTHPGLRRNDQGWYHFSTAAMLEHSTSSQRCSTCSLEGRDGVRAACAENACGCEKSEIRH